MRNRVWGTVEQTSPGRYRARYYDLDGRRRTAPRTFGKRSEAQAWLAAKQTELLTGRQILSPAERERPLPENKTSSITVKEWYIKWLTRCEKRGLSPNTLRAYKSCVGKHVVGAFGALKISDVTPDKVRIWYYETSWKSEALRRNVFLNFSTFMKAAVDEGLIKESPAKIKGGHAEPKYRREIPSVSVSQINEITSRLDEPLAVMVNIAYWCGLRFSEVVALRRRDVNLDDGFIRVSRAVKRGIGGDETIGMPKSRAGLRSVAIPAPCLKVLADYIKSGFLGGEKLLFPMPKDAGKPMTNKYFHYRFDPVCSEVGLAGLRFHDLRHNSMTMAAQTGATISELMARAGHSTPDMALRYQHASRERDRVIAERMANL